MPAGCSQELRDIKHKAHEACRRFNQMDEYDESRLPIIREFVGAIGVSWADPVQLRHPHLYR